MVSPNGRFHPNEADVAAKVMDGEAIIINLSNGMYYSMDQVGGLIWEMMTEEHTLDEISSAVVRSYDVSAVQAQVDIQRLVAELLDENLVVPSTRAAPAGNDGKQAQQNKLPYEQPCSRGQPATLPRGCFGDRSRRGAVLQRRTPVVSAVEDAVMVSCCSRNRALERETGVEPATSCLGSTTRLALWLHHSNRAFFRPLMVS
jgi:hypothetical protein